MHIPAEMLDTLRESLIKHAKQKNLDFHQYDGFFDNFVLYRVATPVRFKSAGTYEVGELVIGSPEAKVFHPQSPPTITVYNPMNGFNVAFPANCLERV